MNGAALGSIMGYQGVGIKVRSLDFLKVVKPAVLVDTVWYLRAHWQACKQKHASFFPLQYDALSVIV